MKKVPIRLNTSNALRWLGSLYRSPAEAIKEHVSNAVDEHLKACARGEGLPTCEVSYAITKKSITIDYPYGMSKDEFHDALQRVADSAKRSLDVNLIGQLGIGMFSFLQIGKTCVFVSKKGKGHESVKVTLRDGSDEALFEAPRNKERIAERGIRIAISDLYADPTKPRGPLAPARLGRIFAEKYDKFLRSGTLKIDITVGKDTHTVRARDIDLPRIGRAYKSWHVPGGAGRPFGLELYFDPSGKGRMAVRHSGVTIVEDLRAVEAYGLEESVYASGYVRGFVDADFLKPLPARSGFEENDDWLALLGELDRLRPVIEAEVDGLRHEVAEERLAEVQRRAVEIVRDILDADDFRDLELLEGLGRKPKEVRIPASGFEFSPSSVRVEEGRRARVTLKALVPKVVPDGAYVTFSVSDTSVVELRTDIAILRAADANSFGVVSVPVFFVALRKTARPIVIVARTEGFQAEARVRVSDFKLAREPKVGTEGEGRGLNYRDVAFEEGPNRHSRYVDRMIEINNLNEDFKREVGDGSPESQLAYAALLIGKETIAFNDKTGATDEYLEKLLSFYYRLRSRLNGAGARRRSRGPQAK